MSKCRKWVLTLGLMAVTPGITMAAPKFPNIFARKAQPARQAEGTSNQRIADNIATALRDANISGYDIAIEQKDGTAMLSGKVTDPRLKAKATEIVGRVPGVKRVDNQLEVVREEQPQSQVLAAEFKAPRQGGMPANAVQQVSATTASTDNNQIMAQQIADSLAKAGLSGYDVEIRYDSGTALLAGAVRNPEQKDRAHQAASSVPGVDNVENRLVVLAGRMPQQMTPQMAQQMQMAQQQRGGYPGGSPFANAAFQGGQPAPGAPGTPPMAMSYGHPGAGAANAVYNSPNLPEHAWPSYASYPNYSQVAYPKQYSASAWPYIGPFYPYPQVPLGWRQVQLEWDDGSWNLNFRPRTDKWWWFLNPKNW